MKTKNDCPVGEAHIVLYFLRIFFFTFRLTLFSVLRFSVTILVLTFQRIGKTPKDVLNN